MATTRRRTRTSAWSGALSSWVPDPKLVRRCLIGSRIALPVAVIAAAVLVTVGYQRVDDLSDDAEGWLTLGPAALFGLAVGVHVVHRHRGRKLGLVRGWTWLDLVVAAVTMAGIGIVVSVFGNDMTSEDGDFLFDAGISLWVMGWFATGFGWLLVLSFVDGPLQLARRSGKRAGWCLLMVMAAVYLLAISLGLYENVDDPPAMLSLPGAIVYGAVAAIGVVLIHEQTKAAGLLPVPPLSWATQEPEPPRKATFATAQRPAGKNKRDHHRTGRGHR